MAGKPGIRKSTQGNLAAIESLYSRVLAVPDTGIENQAQGQRFIFASRAWKRGSFRKGSKVMMRLMCGA